MTIRLDWPVFSRRIAAIAAPVLLGAAIFPAVAHAGDRATPYAVTTPEPVAVNGKAAPTTQAGKWLEMQASGSAASTSVQYATPRERELTYRRLLESYRYAIPEFFDQYAGGEITE